MTSEELLEKIEKDLAWCSRSELATKSPLYLAAAITLQVIASEKGFKQTHDTVQRIADWRGESV